MWAIVDQTNEVFTADSVSIASTRGESSVVSSTCGARSEIALTDMTKTKQSGAFKDHRFPSEIIAYAVWSCFRFPLSLRDVKNPLAARGIIVSLPMLKPPQTAIVRQRAPAMRASCRFNVFCGMVFAFMGQSSTS